MNRTAQVKQIIRQLRDQDSDCPIANDLKIRQTYPHLMPELGHHLDLLRGIEKVVLRAEQPAQRPKSEREEPDEEFREDLEFLRDALDAYEFHDGARYGGQGIVYKALHKQTKRTVAVKLLLDGPLATQEQRDRFSREIEFASRLRHPNIVTLYDSGSIRGRLYYTMAYVDGLDIDEYVCVNAMTVRAIVALFCKVCQAVNYAHQRGILHRDLKPPNILVDEQGQPHILDFGLARETGVGSAGMDFITLPGQVFGTLPYLSPEEAAVSKDGVDVRSDIYSLGVVFFELLTESFPYPMNGNREAVRENIIHRDAKRLRKALADQGDDARLKPASISDDLEAILCKTLDKKRARRYQSVAALADDLERYLKGDAVQAKADSRFYLLRATIRKYRTQSLVALAFMLVLAGGLVGTTLMWQRAERDKQVYGAALSAASHVRLGSVSRDEGRVKDAVTMFTKAIELAKAAPISDSIVNRYLFESHLQLAQIHIGEKALDLAAQHSNAATAIAEQLTQQSPDDPEWLRLLGFCHRLNGRVLMAKQDWKPAIEELERAASIRERLIEVEPDNLSLQSELAAVKALQGQCCRKLGAYDESFNYYYAAHEVHKRLSEQEPNSTDWAMKLLYSYNRLTSYHISVNSPTDDQIALDWMDKSDTLMSKLEKSGQAELRRADIQKLARAIQANRSIINGRTNHTP